MPFNAPLGNVGTSGDDMVIVRATPSYIPKWASCRLYKKSGLGEMRCDGVIIIRYDQEW